MSLSAGFAKQVVTDASAIGNSVNVTIFWACPVSQDHTAAQMMDGFQDCEIYTTDGRKYYLLPCECYLSPANDMKSCFLVKKTSGTDPHWAIFERLH